MRCIRQTLWRGKSSPLLKRLKGRTSPEVSVCARAYFGLLREKSKFGYKACGDRLAGRKGVNSLYGNYHLKMGCTVVLYRREKTPRAIS